MHPSAARSAFILPTFALAALLTGCGATGAARTASDLDQANLLAARDAYFAAWTKGPGPFDMAALERVCDNTSTFLSFDAISPSTTIIRGWGAYAGIWSQALAGYTSASLTPDEHLAAFMTGHSAWTASLARVNGTLPDGTVLDVPVHVTLVWQLHGREWRIVHEHVSAPVRR
ncbi:MAG: nuclear transport factor 2 family protein [Phycisphaeraceae bacterium]|nr:MAG: nuclear transport factor 2 family protein [Phycisphaeraceae bacterium]